MHTPLFSPKSLQQHLVSLPEPPESALERAMEWKRMIDNRSVLAAKETELDGQFLAHFFRDVLGFSDNRATGAWTLTKNQTSHADSSVPDGVLGFFAMLASESVSRVHAVIELKDASHDLDKGQKRQNDKRSPVEQAFSYAPKAGGNCKWVIVSNYLELRLYHHSDQSKYERFELSRLTEPHEMKRLLFLMHRDNLLPLAEHETTSRTEELFAARVKEEDRITKEFYAEYKQARNDLFKHLCAANPTAPELLVLNKTQKLLDRVIFVCFVEDKEIIPRRTFRRLLDDVKRDKFNRSDTKIWDRVRGLFAAINEGYPDEHINKFNGGLFADDADLDALSIKDSVLEHIIALEKYDFDSDLNVNILGHIFEQSITDIEELKAQIAGAAHDASKGKRKKDGIFYTPEYITRYIVQETVGGYLEERKAECGFGTLPALTETDWQSIKRDKRNVLSYNKTIQQHIEAWTAYREKLAAVKVCDPACGSGAFLNQVFDFLYAEGQRVNTELARLQLGQTTTSDLQKDILQNNIYGVDVNPESVEITRLSLWLKTADRSKELTSLDHTIRCGNSLVDDPKVAGETAFDWAAAFPEVMQHGGFDVIVGNPPYGAELSQQEQNFLTSKFALGSSETAICFIKQGFEMLTVKGKLGYIIPKAFAFASNYAQVRTYIWENVTELVDCRKVWQEVKLEQVIVLLSKNKTDKYDSCIRRGTEILSVGIIAKSTAQAFGFLLNGVSSMEIAIAEKMRLSSVMLNDIATNQRGAMLQQHIKEHGNYTVLGGAEIGRMGLRGSKGKIEEGAIDDDKAFVKPNSVLVQNIVAHIENPADHIKIIAALISDDEAQKIAIVDTINQITIEPAYKAHYIWALLNSKLVNWYAYRFIFGKAVRTMHFDSPITSRLPIPKASKRDQQPFITHAETMLTTTRSLADLRKRVLTLLCSETGIMKPSTKLQTWDTLTWSELEAELKKAKVQLSLDKKEELLTYFEKKQQEASALKATLQATDHAIDGLVYELYGLTAE